MNLIQAACGHVVSAVGAPGSAACRECESSPCLACRQTKPTRAELMALKPGDVIVLDWSPDCEKVVGSCVCRQGVVLIVFVRDVNGRDISVPLSHVTRIVSRAADAKPGDEWQALADRLKLVMRAMKDGDTEDVAVINTIAATLDKMRKEGLAK